MNKKLSIRTDQETYDILEKLAQQLKTSKSDIIRMSVIKFDNYVKRVSR